VHASSRWSREHLEADAQEAAQWLQEFRQALGTERRHRSTSRPIAGGMHSSSSPGLPCLVDEEIAAGACGDCASHRVEAAFESGRALAH
jgi:predicted NAD/FAD-dependent oxidoreductase